MDFCFYKNKRVLVTGHTGFKGAWLCGMLLNAGAAVTGFALEPPQGGAFELCRLDENIDSRIGDIRDFDALRSVFLEVKPEIVIHMAAQPLVLDSYKRPAYTFDTNIQGTVNVLECVRQNAGVTRSLLVVTTDKVYRNNEWVYGYRENDELGGDDPYAASKACAELVVKSYDVSFLREMGIPVSTVRSGNVIGGGDVSENRILPDCIRQTRQNGLIYVRNPDSVRPFQHVLEPLSAYLLIAQRQEQNITLAGDYNIGPNTGSCITTAELTEIFCKAWGEPARFEIKLKPVSANHEAGLLRLCCDKIRNVFGWQPLWDIKTAVEMTVAWEKSEDVRAEMYRQIALYQTN